MCEYQKYEYCISKGCPQIVDGNPKIKEICQNHCEAWSYHNYLQGQEYKIIKAERLLCLEEGNKAMTSVLTKIADFLDVEQGNVEQLLAAIEDLKMDNDEAVGPSLTCAACGK